MSLTNLIKNVKGWSTAKNLDKADPVKQMQKLNEEFGELNEARAKGNQEKLEDSIGDVVVVLTILSQQMKFEKIESLIDPMQNGLKDFMKNEKPTDMLLLYAAKEIGLIANCMIEHLHNPNLINTRTSIRFHIRNLVWMLAYIAINEGTDIESCLQMAWDEIKDRKGKMVDGVFVKQEDLGNR